MVVTLFALQAWGAGQFTQIWSISQNLAKSDQSGSAAHIADADGNVILTCENTSPTTGLRGTDTLKYSGVDGHLMWEARFDGSATGTFPSVVALDAAGNVIVAGSMDTTPTSGTSTSQSSTPLYMDVFVVKYSGVDGSEMWHQSFNLYTDDMGTPDGLAHDEEVQAVALDSDGNIVLTGSVTHTDAASTSGTSDTADSSTTTTPISQILTLKCDAQDGHLLWWTPYMSPGNGDSYGYAVTADGNGDVFIAGAIGTLVVDGSNSSTNYYYFFAKYSGVDGTLAWSVTKDQGLALSVAVDSSNNVIVTGTDAGAAYTVKYASDGSAAIWVQSYNGTAGAGSNALALDPNGNVAITGYSTNSNGTTRSIYTAEYAGVDGTLLWQQTQNAAGVGLGVAFDGQGDVISLGGPTSTTPGRINYTQYKAADGSQLLTKQFGDQSDSLQYIPPLSLASGGNAYMLVLSTVGSGTTQFNHYVLIAAGIQPVAEATTGSATLQGGGSTSVELDGTVTPSGTATTAWFVYGEGTAFDHATASQDVGSGVSPVDFNATISDLKPHTAYQFRLVTVESGVTTYGQTVTFTTADTPPVAVDDYITARTGATVLSGSVLGNDSDPDGDALTVSAVGTPTYGTSSTDGTLVYYSPGPNFAGSDSFTYTISDGYGGTATATVHVQLTDPSTTCIALRGSKVTGSATETVVSGTVYATLGLPSINSAGQVAFQATMRTPTGTTKSGIFAGASPVLIAQNGDAAPGITNAKFATFKDPLLDQQGNVTFIATVSGVAANNTGIWSNASGTLSLVVRKGAAAPGVSTHSNFGSFLSLAVPEGGGLIFTATLSTGGSGIWLVLAGGTTPSLLVSTGSSVVVDGKSRKVSAVAVFGSLNGSPGQRRGFDATGEVLVRATFSDGTKSLLVAKLNSGSSSSTITPFATRGGTITGLAGAQSAAYDLGCLADDDTGTFLSTLVHGKTVSALNDRTILNGTAGSNFSVVARTGDSIPGLTGSTYQTLLDPVANRAGNLAFLGTINPGGKAPKPFATGLWTAPNGSTAPALMLQTGSTAPGVTGGKFAGISSLALPGVRGPAFVGTLQAGAGNGSTQSNTGLWAQDINGKLQLLVRSGASFTADGITRTPQSFSILSAQPLSPSQGQGYAENGGFVYRATFFDGSQGIFAAWVP